MDKAARRVRLPLQVGTSALGHAAAGALTIVPGAWAAVALIRMFAAGRDPSISGVGFGFRVFVGLVGAYLAVYGLLELRRAWGVRASDLMLDAEGFSIEGGRHDGVRLRWAELDHDRSRAETVEEVRLTLGKIVGDIFFLLIGLLGNELELAPDEKVPLRRLFVVTRDGHERLLAEAVHPAEQASVDALVETIHARTRPPSDGPTIAPPNVLACPNCGAALTPVDADQVGCAYCEATCAVPADLRERLRALVEVSASKQATMRALAELLDQPGAGAANLALMLASLASLLTWAAAIGVLLVFSAGSAEGVDALDAFDVTMLLGAGVSLCGVWFLWARGGLARRRALHLVTAAYGAKPARDGRAGWTCRQCGGALADHAQLVESCPWCGAENVLGVDLRPDAIAGRAHQLSLEQLLGAARAERRRFAGLGLLGVGLAALVFAVGVEMLLAAQAVARHREGCAKDQPLACRRLADAVAYGNGAVKNEPKACGLYQKACDLDDAEACDRLASCHLRLVSGFDDQAKGDRLRRKACKMGYEPACKSLEE